MILFVSPSVTYAIGNSADMAHQLVFKDSKMYTVFHHTDARTAKIAV